ncbi:MAG: Fic family protein [Planctomycetes bacterium]|nr:Fic family protein [Planctomycetota bacterium]
MSCLLFAAAAAVAGELDLNPLNGALELERADLVVGEGNAAYTLLRSHQPVLGRTWHWSCDSRLALDSGDGVLWIDESGSAVAFSAEGDGWVSTHGAPQRLTRDGEGYVLNYEGRTFRFDAQGRLLSRTSRGVTLRFVAGPLGTTAIQGPWGSLTLERGPFGVQRAALEGREVRYGYRDALLVSVDRGAQKETYSYDDRGRVNRADETRVHYDAEGRVTHLVGGRVPLTASYSAPEGTWTCEVREGARTTRYSFDEARRTLEVAEAGETSSYTFDARQRPRTVERDGKLERSWRYDRQGRLTLLHAPAGDLKLRYGGGDQPSQAELPSGEELRFVYDDAGRLLAATSPAGTERFAYDAQGQLIKHQDADGRQTLLQRDARGYLTAIQAPAGVTRIKRSSAGEVLAVKHPDGRVVEFSEQGAAIKVVDTQGTVQASAFDAQGRMIAFQDEFGRASRVDYNGFGLIARSYDKDGDRFRCAYDDAGQLTAVTDAANNTVTYTRPDAQTLIVDDPSAGRRVLSFDRQGRVVQEVRGDATLRFRYDAQGRLLARSTPRGEERFAYDRAGRLLSQAGPDGELRYTYDAQGRLLTCENRVLFERVSYRYEGASQQPSEVIYPWGSVRYRYDASGRLTDVVAGEEQVQIERAPDGRRARVRYSSGVETRYAYQGSLLAEVSTWRGSTLLSKRAYTYDARGRIASVSDEADRTTAFTHDRRGRLLSAEGPEQRVRYAYDAAGNRTAVELAGEEPRALELGEGNRVLAYAGASYTYGSHGALVAREGEGGDWRYDVDVDGRLEAAHGPGEQTVRYGYAPDGTPLWREANGERHAFLVDRQQVVGEFKDGGLLRRYVRGEDLDDLLWSDGEDGRWTFHRDLVGSVTALTDVDGEVVARYRYGAFGEGLASEGPAAERNPWRFAGRPLDAVTGLYDVRARHYDPTLGRFTAPDPSGREGGLNLYAYAENDPTRLTDPLGLAAELGARSTQTPAPRQGWFSRMLSAVDRAGQSLPGPTRFLYNITKGVAQAAKDTVVGIGELFQKETWVALGQFVSELDDWETVKAVGKHLLDASVDVGTRYIDAALNDPDEFARMTGYGAGMIAGSVLGSKGIDKLAKVARAAKAARLARRAANVADDVVDARRRLKPVLVAAAGAADEAAGAVDDVARAGAGAGAVDDVARSAGSGSSEARKGIAQALDESTPLGKPHGDLYRGLQEGLDAPVSPAAREALLARSQEIARRAEQLRAQRGSLTSDLLNRERMGSSGTVRGTHGGVAGTDGASIAARNFTKADDLVREWAKSNEPLTVERIQQLNATLGEGLQHNGGVPGQLRTAGLDASAGGAPAKVYVLGEQVEEAMADFVKWYQAAEKSGMDPIELAARSYQRLVSIHPFYDANGRTTRLVMDYVLQRHGLPPAAMSDVNVAVFGAERAWGISGISTTPEQAIEKVTAGVERSLELLRNGG